MGVSFQGETLMDGQISTLQDRYKAVQNALGSWGVVDTESSAIDLNLQGLSFGDALDAADRLNTTLKLEAAYRSLATQADSCS